MENTVLSHPYELWEFTEDFRDPFANVYVRSVTTSVVSFSEIQGGQLCLKFTIKVNFMVEEEARAEQRSAYAVLFITNQGKQRTCCLKCRSVFIFAHVI